MPWKFFTLFLSVFSVSGIAIASPVAWKAEGWTKTDFSKTTINWLEIQSGGPPKDGIPSIDQPKFTPASQSKDLASVDPIISIEINGDARAYPLRILIWHEIVNDTVGGTPVAITYCPLCNSAVVFDRRVNKVLLDFGTTGKLRNSDLVMYDRQTESWWQQFTGEAIVGKLTGAELKLLPARLESFGSFKARNPQGKLLVPNDPQLRNYGRNPYVGYDSAAKPFMFSGELPEGIAPMARVIVVRAERNTPILVSFAHVRENGKVKIGRFELSWHKGSVSALDSSTIIQGRDVGSIKVRDTSDMARAVPYDVTFAFVAHAFHPDVKIVGSSEDKS